MKYLVIYGGESWEMEFIYFHIGKKQLFSWKYNLKCIQIFEESWKLTYCVCEFGFIRLHVWLVVGINIDIALSPITNNCTMYNIMNPTCELNLVILVFAW